MLASLALPLTAIGLGQLVPCAQADVLPVTSGLQCWFDASQGTTTDGSGVLTWGDQSGNGHTATRAQGTMQIIAGAINGLPAVQFAGNAYAPMTGNMYSKTQFVVTKMNGGDWGAWMGSQVRGGYMWNQNGNCWDQNVPAAVSKNGTALAGYPFNLGEDRASQYMVLKIVGNNTNTSQRTFELGRQEGWNSLNNFMAEIIAYDRVLSADEENLVGGYLAKKYLIGTAYPAYPLMVSVTSPAEAQGYVSGSPVTATATVPSLAGTGPYNVQFYLKTGGGSFVAQGSPVAGAGPTFDLALGTLADNTYQIYADVSDTVGGPVSSATNTFTVQPAVPTTTALATSGTPSTYGQTVTFTATVSPMPTGGTVQFYSDATPLGSPVAVNTGTGTAQYSTSLLTVPTHSITADYSGYQIYVASSAPSLSQTVDQAVLTVTADNKVRNPGAANPTLTYKISGYKNGENLGSSGVLGAADLTCPAAPDGSSVVGAFPILCNVGDLAAPNYSFTTVNGTLTVMVGAPPVSNGMVCWYDASTIAVADGTQVNTWNDLSGNGHTATRASGAPVLSYSDIKYNSSEAPKKGVHFRGTDDFYDCAGGMWVKEQYVVVRSPNPTWVGSGSFLGRKSNDFLTVRASSHNLFSGYTGFWDDELPFAVSKNGAVVSSSRGSMPRGGFELGRINDYMILKIVATENASAANRAAYPYYQIGRTETLSGVEMDIAEIIGYETTLSSGDEAAVGSYLKAKYGLAATYPDPTPQAVITSFTASGLPAVIDQARRTIAITTPIGTDVSALVPTFTLSADASCTVNSSLLESGVTAVNFTGLPVHCIVTSLDSAITADYAVSINYVSTLTTAITVLDVTTPGDGSEILNDGTLVPGAANHVGPTTGLTALTLPNGLTFGISTAHLTGYGSNAWGGGGQSTNTDSNSAGAAGALTDATDYGKLMRQYIWSSAASSSMAIPGLVPGHTYRLQWITTSPRGGNISVEGSPSVALAPNSAAARVFAFTWVAVDTVANALVTRQPGSYPTDSEIVFNGYALHDMGVYLPAAAISGVTPSQTIPPGTPTVTLSGTVSDGGTIYPAAGEAVSVTINGVTEYAPVDSVGVFSITIPTASLAGGVAYPITYSYAGNWITLASAPNDTSTTLSVSAPGVISNVTPSPTRVVGGYPTVTLSGTVSNGGTGYAGAGEPVNITINGVTQTANVSGSVGAFSIAYPLAGIPLGPHTITYSYAGNGLMLTAAPDNTSTTLTMVATAGTAYKSLVQASGPVSYWPLNETSGTTALDIVGTNNITYGGASPANYTLNQESLRSTDGQPSVLFTSGNSQAPYNSSLNPSQFTVEAWVKPTNTAAVQYLVSLQDRSTPNRLGYALWKVNGSAGFGVMAGNGTAGGVAVNGATVAEAGKNYHVVGTYDGTTLKLYVNGGFEGSAPVTYVPATPSQPGFSIGSRNGATVSPSYIQDVALYNRALTAQEILTHYQGGFATAGGYSDWAATYAGGANAPVNGDFNNDGVQNGIAYFMGKNGLATNPGVEDGKVTWNRVNDAPFEVQVSDNLTDWSPAPSGDVNTTDPTKVVYTFPKLAPKEFCRLSVTP